jgi:Methylene-tetrahydrofolate reductase C terminal
MTRVMVELARTPPAGDAPGTARASGPRSVPHRPRLSARLAYLMQKVLKPNSVNRRIGRIVEHSPAARKAFTAAERASKERLFGCRMCGQCALPVTGYSCPMGCPKELRNGPCGGVGPGGACEVYPEKRCVWVVGFERAASQGAAADLRRLQRPVDHRRWGESSWLNYWAGRDENLWTDDDSLASPPVMGLGPGEEKS